MKHIFSPKRPVSSYLKYNFVSSRSLIDTLNSTCNWDRHIAHETHLLSQETCVQLSQIQFCLIKVAY
ncbi:hypothetical protein GIB67_003705 [Kingdonia uniflora]|uniref:Uncharacterized protein n=1 Tax=Kingdonia uniflora TaxID=39325 RepID=A0A7J7M3V8_9MAGN|nr:hypothetical protein GIB67_003705 [Kingdonia uniflora]